MPRLKSTLQRARLTYHQKAEIVKHATDNQFAISHELLAKWAKETFALFYTPHRTTIGRVIEKKHKYLVLATQDQFIRRTRVVHFSALDTALSNCVMY